MSKSTRTSDNAGHTFSDHTIAARVRAAPDVASVYTLLGPHLHCSMSMIRAIITTYRAMLLADEPPLDDEQRIERSAP